MVLFQPGTDTQCMEVTELDSWQKPLQSFSAFFTEEDTQKHREENELVQGSLTGSPNLQPSGNGRCSYFKNLYENSLAVQWLGLCAFTAEGAGSFPGQGTKIPQAVW